MEANPYYLTDANGEYYNKYPEFEAFEEGRKAGIREAISIYELYIELLGQEIDTLSPLAIAHGWRSTRIEAGEKCREEIDKLMRQVPNLTRRE